MHKAFPDPSSLPKDGKRKPRALRRSAEMHGGCFSGLPQPLASTEQQTRAFAARKKRSHVHLGGLPKSMWDWRVLHVALRPLHNLSFKEKQISCIYAAS